MKDTVHAPANMLTKYQEPSRQMCVVSPQSAPAICCHVMYMQVASCVRASVSQLYEATKMSNAILGKKDTLTQ